ncbi:hypothetical protein GCM10028783_27510 [Modestobacter muralis]
MLYSHARQAFCSSASSQRGGAGAADAGWCSGPGDTWEVTPSGYWRNSQGFNYASGRRKQFNAQPPEVTMTSTTQIPGYVVGTWDIDASHSTVGFSVRHMMVSKVRGYFREFSGEIVTAADPSQSTVHATIDMDSIDTRQEQRDAHIKSADFFDTGNHTVMEFRSTGIRNKGEDWVVEGNLTIKGITKPVVLDLELNGFGPDAYGGTRAGFSGKTEISRKEFGVDIDMPMDGGGVVVGDKITVELEIEGVLRAA